MREDQKKEISKEESQKVKSPHMLDHYLVVPPTHPKVM